MSSTERFNHPSLMERYTPPSSTEDGVASPVVDKYTPPAQGTGLPSAVESTSDEAPSSVEAEDIVSQGPLSRLVDRASRLSVVRQAQQHVPESARPVLERTKEPASRAIGAVDRTLQTEEAQNVASSAVSLFYALKGFTVMLLTSAVSSMESALDITPTSNTPHSESVPIGTSPSDSHTGTQPRDGEFYEQQQHRTLFTRYLAVCRAAFHKASSRSSSSASAGNNENNISEVSTTDTQSLDRVVLRRARASVEFAKEISAQSLSRAANFSGPGSSKIKPAARYVISHLPEDMRRTVHEIPAAE